MSGVNDKKDSVLENSVLEVDNSFSKGTGEVSVVSASELTNADMTSSDFVLDESALAFGAPQKESRSTEQSIKDNTEPVMKEAVPLMTVSESKKPTTQHSEDSRVAEEKVRNAAKSGPPEVGHTTAIKKVQSITEDEQGKVKLDLCENGKELCNGVQEDIEERSNDLLEDGGTVESIQDNYKHTTESGNGTPEGVASSMAKSTLSEGKNPEKNNSNDHKSENQFDWVDILGSGELQKKVLQPGKGLSTRPTHQSRVKLRVRGILHCAGGPDKSVDKHSSVSFTVGDGDVIQAWDIAVTLMEVGEVARVKTSARFAYGDFGKPPSIPGNAALTYELELLEVHPPLLLIQLTEEELVELVEVKKTRGNELYKREEYSKALNSYHKGLQAVQSYLDSHKLSIANASPVVAQMLVRCQNNIAATQLKAKNYSESLAACESVLKLDADNVKALYRAGRVLGHLGEWAKAVVRLEKAAQLDPDNKVIQTELQKTLKKKEASDKKEKEMYRRMVGGSSQEKGRKSKSTSSSESSWGPWPYLAISGVAAVLAIGAAYFITQRP